MCDVVRTFVRRPQIKLRPTSLQPIMCHLDLSAALFTRSQAETQLADNGSIVRQNIYPRTRLHYNTSPSYRHYKLSPQEQASRLPEQITMAPNWDRLIRFLATDGRELRGQPILPSPDFDVGTTTEATGLKAKVISVANGDIFDAGTKVTDEEVTVKKLLGPVTVDEVPIIRCIGLNFIKHSMHTRT